MKWTHAASFALSLGLVACGPARPGDGEIRDLIAASVGAAGDDAYAEMQEFRRVDGRDAGEGRYIADVEYDLVYLVSSEELTKTLSGKLGRPLVESLEEDGDSATARMNALGFAVGLMPLMLNPFEKGETRHQAQTVTLER